MKRSFTLLTVLVVFSLFSCAGQQVVPSDERIFTKECDLPGNMRSVLYQKTLRWLAETYISSDAVIEYQNEDAGIIIGNGVAQYNPTGFGDIRVRYTIKFEIHEGRTRVGFKNMAFIGKHGNYSFETRSQLDSFIMYASALVEEYKEYIMTYRSSW